MPLNDIKTVSYVRDFNLSDTVNPERLTRRTFLAKPRTEGLWLRLTLTAGDPLEGLAPLDLAFADNLLEDRGLYLIPPDIRSNTQRLFIPRTAIATLQILAVITNLDREHMDCYRDMADVEAAFVSFMDRVPFYGAVTACADDPLLDR